MHLRLPSDVPSRALRRKAHRAPASGEGLVAPDQRPCLLGVGFPSSGPRVWTFTSSLWVMPLAPGPRRLRRQRAYVKTHASMGPPGEPAAERRAPRASLYASAAAAPGARGPPPMPHGRKRAGTLASRAWRSSPRQYGSSSAGERPPGSRIRPDGATPRARSVRVMPSRRLRPFAIRNRPAPRLMVWPPYVTSGPSPTKMLLPTTLGCVSRVAET